MFPLVMFDLDGTLVNTIPDIAFAVNSALESIGEKAIPSEDVKMFVGRGLRNALKGALEFRHVTCSDCEFERLYSCLMDTYRKNPCTDSHPYNGIPLLLSQLQDKGIRFGIFSSKEGELIRKITDKLFPGIKFGFIEGRYEKYKPKPDPEAVRAFVGDGKIEDLVYVGDSEVDFETAENAGCTPVIVTWGFRSRRQLESLGICNLIDSVDELKRRIME